MGKSNRHTRAWRHRGIELFIELTRSLTTGPLFAAVVVVIDGHEFGKFGITFEGGRREGEHGRAHRPTFDFSTLAETMLVTSRHFAGNLGPVVEHLSLVLACSVVDALHSLRTAFRSDCPERRRLGLPSQAVRVYDVQSEV